MKKKRKKIWLSGINDEGSGRCRKAAREFGRDDEDGPVPPPKSFSKYHAVTSGSWGSYPVIDIRMLDKLIDKYVGKDFDLLQSKLANEYDKRTTEGYEVSYWLSRNIDMAPVFDGQVYERNCSAYADYYVDCKNIIRKFTQSRYRYVKRKRPRLPPTTFVLDGERYWQREDGLWYRVMMRPYKSGYYGISDNDGPLKHWDKETVKMYFGVSIDGSVWYPYKQDPINTRDKQKIREFLERNGYTPRYGDTL